jgi:FkbM family methyltransferase
MKRFLDIGAWTGASAEFFLRNHPQAKDFEIISFECDRRNIEVIKRKHLPITLIEKAAWIYNGLIKFYPGNGPTKAGGTLYPYKTSGGVSDKVFYNVGCVDIARYLDGDYTILKLNCEGAEYDIISYLYGCGLLHKVDKWFVQWHWDKIGVSKARHDEVSGMIDWSPWNAQFNQNKFVKEFLKTI